jgi:hypothetical protein
MYRVFSAKTDLTFILPSELPTKELCHLQGKIPSQAYQTSQYVVPCGVIFLGKWHSSFTGRSDGKMNVQIVCALNTRYFGVKSHFSGVYHIKGNFKFHVYNKNK